MSEAERHTARMQALAESAQLFAEESTDLARLLRVVARRFSELVGEAANIRLIEGDALVPVATYHPDPDTNAYLQKFHDETPLKLGEGISGTVIATGEPYYMPSLDLARLKERLAPGFVAIFEKVGITGMIVVRLRARGINLGYLSLFRTSESRPAYTTDDLHLVQDLADRAALAIDNSRLLDGLERRVAERTRRWRTRTGSSRPSRSPCPTISARPSAQSTASPRSWRRITPRGSTTTPAGCSASSGGTRIT